MNRTVVPVLLIAALAALPTVTAQPQAANSESGSATWTFLSLPIDVDSGSARQTATPSYQGDASCSCVATNFLGICVSYEGHGHWYVTWSNTQWDGRNSYISIDGHVTRAVANADANDGFQEGCDLKLSAAIDAGQPIAVLASEGFQDIGGDASGYTNLAIAVPFTTISIGTPIRFQWTGSVDFSGGLAHWDLSGTGTATLLGLRIGTFSVDASSLA